MHYALPILRMAIVEAKLLRFGHLLLLFYGPMLYASWIHTLLYLPKYQGIMEAQYSRVHSLNPQLYDFANATGRRDPDLPDPVFTEPIGVAGLRECFRSAGGDSAAGEVSRTACKGFSYTLTIAVLAYPFLAFAMLKLLRRFSRRMARGKYLKRPFGWFLKPHVQRWQRIGPVHCAIRSDAPDEVLFPPTLTTEHNGKIGTGAQRLEIHTARMRRSS